MDNFHGAFSFIFFFFLWPVSDYTLLTLKHIIILVTNKFLSWSSCSMSKLRLIISFLLIGEGIFMILKILWDKYRRHLHFIKTFRVRNKMIKKSRMVPICVHVEQLIQKYLILNLVQTLFLNRFLVKIELTPNL